MIQNLLAFALFSLQTPLVADSPIVVPGGAGKYDFMSVDPVNRVAFACHPGKSSFTVIGLDSHQVKDVALGFECNGVSADSSGKRAFAAGPGKTLVRIDMTSWTRTGELPLDGPGDCVQFDSKRGVVYVDNDDGTNVWIVDPGTMKLSGAVTIKEAPEYMELDNSRGRIFQAIKSTSTVQVIDPESRKVLDEWSLGELTSPHGLALDRKAGRIFVAGKNGKLVVLDAKSGAIVGKLDIVKGSDQIAYDPGLKRLYIPGESKVQVVQVSGDTVSVLGDIPVDKDCHRVAVDPKTHDIWVAYADKANSYVQRFAAK